jgi:uncharacterized protein (TIGR00369 family)
MALVGGCATLPVVDFDKSIRFYTDVLGMRLAMRFGSEWACLDAGNGMLIGLIPGSGGDDERMSVGLCAMDDFDAAVGALCEQGITVDRHSEAAGSVELAHFTDPDGHALYLTNMPPNPTSRFAGQGADDGYRPFMEHLGLRWDTVDANSVSVEMEIRDDLRGPAGMLQGGIIATLVDVAAASTAALAGSFVATTEMTIHYLAPGRVGPVRAVGELLRSGARGFAVEARVYDAGMEHRLIAVALAAFSSFDRQASRLGTASRLRLSDKVADPADKTS